MNGQKQSKLYEKTTLHGVLFQPVNNRTATRAVVSYIPEEKQEQPSDTTVRNKRRRQ